MSLSYELSATNCMKMLQLLIISILLKIRNHDHPLVFDGGITAIANPESYCDFFDFFSIGEFT